MKTKRLFSALALVVLLMGVTASAQQTLDRSKIPVPGKAPELRVPEWTKSTLANGAELIVSEKHDLPLVALTITIQGGSHQAESATRRGVAGITAAMMSEGTKTRDGEALSNALQLLGTSVNVTVGGESGSIGFQSTTSRLPQALDILADMMLNPASASICLSVSDTSQKS
jgi:zinc protease